MADLAQIFNAADHTTPGHYGPAQTALLLLDFHTLFVQHVGGPNAAAALDVAAKLRTWAKSQGIIVIHGLIDLDAAPFPTCKGTKMFQDTLAMMKLNGGEEASELAEGGTDGDVTFTRVPGHVSALKSPGLSEYLQEKGIKSLILTGLSSSGCVLRSCIAATDAEFVVTVISDGCADRDQEVHDLVVTKLVTNRGYVTTGAEFQGEYEKVRAAK